MYVKIALVDEIPMLDEIALSYVMRQSCFMR